MIDEVRMILADGGASEPIRIEQDVNGWLVSAFFGSAQHLGHTGIDKNTSNDPRDMARRLVAIANTAAPELEQVAEITPLTDIREAYEESHDDEPDEVGLGEPADDDTGGDLGAEEADSPPDDPDPSDAVDEPDPAQLGGVLIQGDALTTSKALLSWQVDAIEAERLGVYDEEEITSELAALRNRAMGAREYGWTALNDAENEQLQALETFEGHIRAIQAHSRSLRGQIRDAVDEPALALIDIQSGWPE